MGRYKKWYVNGKEVPYLEYKKAIKHACVNKLSRYVRIYRLNELAMHSLRNAMGRYFLDKSSYIENDMVGKNGVDKIHIKTLANNLVELENISGSVNYFDHRGKLIDD